MGGLVVWEIVFFSRISFQMISDMLHAQHTGSRVSSVVVIASASPMTTPGGIKADGYCKINSGLVS